ncbi:MAG: hypothetical protein ABI741_00910 [Ferruginibacter sp.]
MDEFILFTIVTVVLLGSQFLLRGIKEPTSNYIRISASAALLLLVWLSAHDGSIGIKILLSSLAISYAIKEFILLRRAK